MIQNDFMKTIHGEVTDGVPFWEVWFAMEELPEYVLGRPMETIDDEIEFARMMGWEYLRVRVPARRPGSTSQVASDGTSHYVQTGRIDLQELYDKPEPEWEKAREEMAPRVQRIKDEGMVAICYLPWAFHSVNTALGLEHFSLLIYDDPEYINAMFDWVEEGCRKALEEVVIPLDIDLVLFDGDCAFKNGLMIRPDMFRELVFERTKTTTGLLRDAGIPYTLHSDGKADELLPILIELGFSAFHGVEAQANDLGEIKERFGEDITLVGNMDVVFLTKATIPEIRAATEEMLKTGSPGGRYMAACNTSPLDYIPKENYLAMVDVINNFSRSSDVQP
ncbi:MAG: uroporphyrinogen decarboxylase family protein [Armatimonadota bacterium]